MRRLLLKVLVIAVFLNTVVGLPLHAAVHLAAGGAAEGLGLSTSASGPSDSRTAESEAADEHDDRAADASCAWCLAQAEATAAPPALPSLRWPGDWHEPSAAPETAVPAVFSAGLWSSSPRGPPSA